MVTREAYGGHPSQTYPRGRTLPAQRCGVGTRFFANKRAQRLPNIPALKVPAHKFRVMGRVPPIFVPVLTFCPIPGGELACGDTCSGAAAGSGSKRVAAHRSERACRVTHRSGRLRCRSTTLLGTFGPIFRAFMFSPFSGTDANTLKDQPRSTVAHHHRKNLLRLLLERLSGMCAQVP